MISNKQMGFDFGPQLHFIKIINGILKMTSWEFPGSPVENTSPFNAGGVGSIPGRGTKIPHEARHGKERKTGGQGKPQ